MNDMNIYFFFFLVHDVECCFWMMIDTHTFVFVSSLVFDICLYFTANGNPALVWLGLERTRDRPSSRAFFSPILFSSLLPPLPLFFLHKNQQQNFK